MTAGHTIICAVKAHDLFGVLGTEVLGGVDHVDQSLLGLLPLTGLETTVRVDPELLRLQVLQHLLDAVLDLLLAGNTGRVDIVDTRTNVAGVGLLDEDTKELGVRLAVLDGENISVEGGNGVEEVLELGVTEVRVDLSRVLNADGRQAESLDGPVEVGLTLLARAEGKTLTQGRLVNLDDIDASLLKVNDLVTEGKSKLLSLDGLVDIITGERPSQASDGASQHTLHGLAGDGGGVLGLLDSHGGRARDVTDDDRGTNASGTVTLDPGVSSEGVTLEALTEVLHHVVTLGLTVDVDVQVKLILDLDVHVNLLLNELVVLSLSDLLLGELGTLDTDLLGLGERSNGGGGEQRQVQLLLLLGNSGGELRLAVVVSSLDLGLTLLDGSVVGALRGSTSLDRLGIGLKSLTDGSRALSDSLGDDGNLNSLLRGEREPISDLGVQLLLAGQSVGSVKEGAGSSGNDAVLAELLHSGLDLLNGALQVGLPDVTSIDDTGRQNGLGAEAADDSVELLRVADQVDVDSVDVLGDEVDVVDDVTEVGGEDELGDLVTKAGELLVGRLEGSLGLAGQVQDKDGLVNLNGLGTSLLQLGKELLVDRHKLVEQVDGVNLLATVCLTQVQEGDGTNKDGSGVDTGLLGFCELSNSLGGGSELEGLVVLESGLDVVVVGVKPLNHLQTGNIDTTLLVTTTHGKVFIDAVETGAAVALRDGLESKNSQN